MNEIEKHIMIVLNKIIRYLYFLKSIGFISKIVNANKATKPDLRSVVTLVANGVIEKNSKIGNPLSIRTAYIIILFYMCLHNSYKP